MATLDEILDFTSMSRKDQLDAAFNAGAKSLPEANAMLQEAQAAAQGSSGQGFLSKVGDTLSNLSPEQAQGLISFGTQLSRGIQPGETLMSSLGSAAQEGFATTAEARAAKVKALQERAEQQMQFRAAALANRKQKLAEEKFKREGLADPRMGKIDPFDFTPASLQKFQQTGNFADLVMNPLAKRGTNVNVGGELPFKVPTGHMLADPNNPAVGVVPIPGGPAATMTPEQAAKAQLVQGAITNAQALDRMLFSDGEIDRTNIVNMNLDTPFTEGREARVLLRDSIEAKLRAESGAAVPHTEVIRAEKRFLPSPLDSDSTIKVKRALLNQFLQGTYDKFDPTGAYNVVESIDALIKDADKAGSDSTPEMTLQQKRQRLQELREKAGK